RQLSCLPLYCGATRMSLELCILASGSAGNCSVIRTPAGVVLIDAGIGPRTAQKRLAGTGVSLADVRAICLTHLDADHFRPSWFRLMVQNRVRVFVANTRINQLRQRIEGYCQQYG